MGTEVERLLREQQHTSPTGPSLTDKVLDPNDESSRLRTSMRFSDPAHADRTAQMLRLQERTQMPLEMIDRNFDAVSAEARRADFDPVKFRQHSPIVAAWLAEKPEHPTVAAEDLSRLSYLERQVRYITDQFTQGKATTELRDIGEAALVGNVTPAQRQRQRELQEQLGRMAESDYGITGFFEGVPGAIANQLPIMGRSIMSGLRGAAVGALAGGAAAAVAGQAGPQAATPEEVLTVPGAAGAGAGMGWRLGSLTEVGRMEASLAYLDFEGLKNLDGAPIDRKTAVGAAVTVGVVNGLLENFGFQKMMQAVPGLRGLTKESLRKALASRTTSRAIGRYLREIGETALTEGVTEYMQEVSKNAAQVAADPNSATLSTAALLDRIFQGALQAGRMGAQAGGGFTTVMGSVELSENLKKVRRAQRAQEFFQTLSEGATDSKLLERSPEKMREVLSRLTADGPLESVYLPVGVFNEYFQSKDLDPREAAKEIGVETSYDEAATTSGDLEIPTALYATKLAATEAHATFAKALRLSPLELSTTEAQEMVQALDKEASAEEVAPTQAEQEAEIITAKIAEQLQTARPDLYDEKTARVAAQTFYGNVFQNMSEASGKTPMQLFERYGLSVQLGVEDEPAQPGLTLGQTPSWAEGFLDNFRSPSPLEKQFMAWQSAALDENNSEEIRKVAADKAAVLKPQAEAARTERLATLEKYTKELNTDRTLYQTAQSQRKFNLPKGFHSKAERTITEKMPNVATITDLQGILKDIKAEERKWLGLDEWFESLKPEGNADSFSTDDAIRETGKISKERVLQFLQAHRLEIYEEKQEGKTKVDYVDVIDLAGEMIEQDINRLVTTWENLGNNFEYGEKEFELFHRIVVDPDRADPNQWVFELPVRAFLTSLAKRHHVSPEVYLRGQFEEEGETAPWQIFSHEITFRPNTSSGGGPDFFSSRRQAVHSLKHQLVDYIHEADLDAHYMDRAQETLEDRRDEFGIGDQPYIVWTLPGGENYRILAFTFPQISATYMLPHSHRGVSKSRNVFAHTRLKDRQVVQEDGSTQRMLFIEEMQSDWHQEGREHGYKDAKSERRGKEIEDRLVELNTTRLLSDAQLEEARVLVEELQTIPSQRKAVSDAPFRNTWHEFVLKRLIRLAAEEGFDTIGWTTGEQQADRYRLSEHVQKIQWRLLPQAEAAIDTPVFDIQAWTPEQNLNLEPTERRVARGITAPVPAIRRNVDESSMNENIGKELSRKVFDAVQAGVTEGSFEGEDLNIGGHGQRAFYDGMVPMFLKSFGKKYGAKPTGTNIQIDLRALDDEEMEKLAKTATLNEDLTTASLPVHGMTLTPALKQAALKDEFTLYQMRKAEKGAIWDGAMAELEKGVETIGGILEHYEGDIEAMEREQGESLDEGQIYQRLLEHVQERDAAAAYSFLQSMPTGLQQLMMNLFPITFNWIMQHQVLQQQNRSRLANDALEDLAAILGYVQSSGLIERADWTQEQLDLVEGTVTRMIALIKHDKIEQAATEFKQWAANHPDEYVAFEAFGHDSFLPLLNLYDDEGLLQQQKGRIKIGKSSIKIDLLKDADLSTFIHETGHFYLEMLADLATEADATEGLKTDYATVRKWLGLNESDAITREHHEMFARGFEKYLGEGRAPVPELRRVFAKFKAWLFGVYSSLAELKVELTDEVRNVFDKLIAGHAALEKARDQQGMQPLDLSGFNLPETEIARYTAALEAARLTGEEQLSSKIIQDFEREKSRVWQAERAKVREKVAAEANDDPVLRARALLHRGTLPDGSPLPENWEPFKLSKTAVHAQWLPEIEAGLPRHMTGKTGLHPNIAADLLGFQSGDELLNALIKSDDPTAWIERTTNERMRSRRFSGNPMKASEIPVEAMKAVHNEKRSELLRLELKYLAANNLPALKGLVRRVARRVASTRDVREEAERIILNKELRRVRPVEYQRTESKAAKEAVEALLKGDVEAAFDAKQREQLAHELYRAATRAQDQADKITTYFARFNQQSVRERLAKAGSDYLEQIDAIRARFDFAKDVSLKDLEKRRSLQDFVEDEKSFGLTPAIPEKLLREAYRKSWRQMTLNELQELHDGVKVIEKLSRLKNQLLANNRRRTVQAAVDEMVGEIKTHHEVNEEDIDVAPNLIKRLVQGARGISAAHQKPEFIAEWLDGNINNGPVWSHIFKPIADAESEENALRRVKVIDLKAIFSAYTRFERSTWFWHKQDFGKGLGSMTKANKIAMALNWGNQYNREAVMEGNKLSEAQVKKVLDTLDQKDWQVVQAIWDYLDSFWPEIAALEKELNGLVPEKVEATPVETKHGTFRGGYYPIVFDSRRSFRQSALDLKQDVTELFGGQWSRAMTRHGHTKERSSTGGKPIRFDLSGLTDHVTNVMHDLTHRRAVIDVSRLIRNEEFRQTVERTIGTEFYRQLHPWLVNVAAGQQHEWLNPIESLMGRARTGATVVNMGWKLTTAMVQFLSFTNTVKELGPKYSALGVSDTYGAPWKFRTTWSFVTSRSEFMKHRIENFDRDVNDALKNLNVAGVKAGPLSIVGAYGRPMRDSFFTFIGLMDMGVSLPTWMGSYRQAMEGKTKGIEKGDEPAAIDYADKIVRQTQGVGGAKDLATVQRGPNTLKVFTMFYSYFSVLFNQFAKSTHQLKLDKNVGRYAASLLLLWFLPAALEDVMRGNAPDDEDDPTGQDWLKWLTKVEARYPFQTVAILRDIVNGMDKYGYEPSAAFDLFDNLAKAGKAVLEELPVVGDEDAEFTRADLKSVVQAVGYITQLPSRQLWLTAEYLHDWLAGEEEPANPMEAAWRSLVTGKKKKP